MLAGPLDAAHGEVSDPSLRNPAQTLAGTSQIPALAEEQCPHSWAVQGLGKHRRRGELGPECLCALLPATVPQPKQLLTHLTPPSLLKDTPDFHGTPIPRPKLLPTNSPHAQDSGPNSQGSHPPLPHSTETLLPFMSVST